MSKLNSNISNIFLHYLNKDTQEIFGIEDNQSSEVMVRLKRGLNASILLCEEYCFMPLGFYFECKNTRQLILQNLEFIESGLLRFCIREREIGEYVDKKQEQLRRFRNEISLYDSFFDAKYTKQLKEIMPIFLSRKTLIGEYCVNKWDQQHNIFIHERKGDMYNVYHGKIDKNDTNILMEIQNAARENQNGAFVWNVIKKRYHELNIRDKAMYYQLRLLFEKYYYEAYLEEYNASILYDFFLIDRGEDFDLRKYESVINFSWFDEFLKCVDLSICLDISPQKIIDIKYSRDFTMLYDIYQNLCSEMIDLSASERRKRIAIMLLKNTDDINDLINGVKVIINKIDNNKLIISPDSQLNNFTGSERSKVNMKETKKIFIVHGHDESAKITVGWFLSKLGFDPIILHEQADGGKTIIEKIEKETDVVFAIVLYTPCDEGRLLGDTDLKYRARQNVVFEHGYLIGKLGRDKVCALVKTDNDKKIEKPGDIDGVIYKKMDDAGAWEKEVCKEMKKAGLEVDLNKLL